MKPTFSGLLATLLMAFALTLTACGGDDPEEDVCQTAADCNNGQICQGGECVAEPEGYCETSVDCPGAQTCGAETNVCEGNCCASNFCPSPTQTCDEALCLGGATGTDMCKDLACEPACETGFTCDLFADGGPTCVAQCVVDGCEGGLMCNAETGACEDRLPANGEVGSTCTSDADCANGGECLTDVPGGYCIVGCQTSAECPSGSFCAGGMCIDACDEFAGDCNEGQQCYGPDFWQANSAGCFPLFEISECTGESCLPNGSVCDPTLADQCPAGTACITFTSGLALCQAVQCHQPGNACAEGFECTDIGGLTSCWAKCDATNAMACNDLGLTCQPGALFEGPYDNVRIVASADNCASTETAATVALGGGESVVVCYPGCTTDAQCSPGQICENLPLTDTQAIDVCMTYNVVEGTCAGAVCDTTGCIDLGGTSPAAACFDTCTTDADCTEAPFGRCNTTSYTFNNGASMFVCEYDNTDSTCLPGCTDDTQCDYPTAVCNAAGQCEEPCTTGADCYQGTCAATAGPNGEDVCVVSCTTTAECPSGVCNETVNYCAAE